MTESFRQNTTIRMVRMNKASSDASMPGAFTELMDRSHCISRQEKAMSSNEQQRNPRVLSSSRNNSSHVQGSRISCQKDLGGGVDESSWLGRVPEPASLACVPAAIGQAGGKLVAKDQMNSG